jgi:hypothetical protein
LRSDFQVQHGVVQTQVGDEKPAPQQRPEPDGEFNPFGRRHHRLPGPACIGEAQAVCTNRRFGPVQVDVEIAADLEIAPGARLDLVFDGTLEPVPVPQAGQ